MTEHLTRRQFVATSLAGSMLAGFSEAGQPAAAPTVPADSRQATGVKVGEVTDSAAVVWMRVTANATHNAKGIAIPREPRLRPVPKGARIEDLRGACPGAPGRVRFRYATNPDLSGGTATDWQEVTAERDFTHQFRIGGLKPDTEYHYAAETSPLNGKAHAPLRGRFRTAPTADQEVDARFTVVTGTSYRDLDHPDGFNILPAMARLRPSFFIHTGDNVYYDGDDILANSVPLCRHHWHRMHGLPRWVAFHQQVPVYYEKDDHDTYDNDCWPGKVSKVVAPMTFAQSLPVFAEQTPAGPLPYRTFRWGRQLQIWLPEGRDYRSANPDPDGPKKTIWGAEQKRWLFQSLTASNATFKVLISPTPVVGPDRGNKRDNHANLGFTHEGDEIRNWFRKNLPERFVVCCGDRHWQYHSVHPGTGVHEFSCGPGSNIHAGGSPGLDKQYHRFHRVSGGFLSVHATRDNNRPVLVMTMHDVNGKDVYQYRVT